MRVGALTLCILDPDAYLTDPSYAAKRRAGHAALRNLWAFDGSGIKLWEAQLPEENDYYYEFAGVDPLKVRSFSGYTCVISLMDGTIISSEFHK
jgi:hypothetical protein